MRETVRLAGQRLMVGFEGLDPTPELRELVREHGVGGVILFSRNIADPEQLVGLTRQLQEYAEGVGHEAPLLVAVDQEGGRVARLGTPWTLWPPMRAIGEADDPDLVRRFGEALGRELKAVGIHWDFAPVMDVDTNPDNPVIGDRSLGADPERAGQLGSAFIAGLQGAGVAACAKHFPGHGDTSVDSHLDLPTLDHSLERLEDVELRPFRHAIAAQVASVMTGHLLVPELDARYPATLSARLVTQMLRKEMSFRGVVVSDDLEMRAVADRWPSDAAARLAAAAGCDVLLVCHTPERQAAAHEALVKGLESETLPWAAFEDSVRRIRNLKERFAGPEALADPRVARGLAGCDAHRAVADEIAARAGMRA